MSIRATLIVAVLAVATPALAQHEGHDTSTSAASADLARCVQTQAQIGDMLTGFAARLESARQSNSAATMRATLSEVDALFRQLREQLAPCSRLQVTPPPVEPPRPAQPAERAAPAKSGEPAAGAVTSSAQVAKPTEHEHTTQPARVEQAEPVTNRPAPQAAGAPPAATVPPRVSGPAAAVTAPPSAPPPASRPAAAVPAPSAASTRPTTQAPPVATSHEGHDGHTAPATATAQTSNAPSSTAPTSAPASSARRPTAAASTPTLWATQVESLRCTTGVMGKGAPQTTYQGTTYYFCSEHDRLNFLRNPAAAINGRRR